MFRKADIELSWKRLQDDAKLRNPSQPLALAIAMLIISLLSVWMLFVPPSEVRPYYLLVAYGLYLSASIVISSLLRSKEFVYRRPKRRAFLYRLAISMMLIYWSLLFYEIGLLWSGEQSSSLASGDMKWHEYIFILLLLSLFEKKPPPVARKAEITIVYHM